MYGPPCILFTGAIIVRQHWCYIFNEDGSKKAHNCCNGSLKTAPQLRVAEQNYSSCVDHPNMHLFDSLFAYLDMLIYYLDAVNPHANAKGPTIQTYVYVDDAYAEWYTRHMVGTFTAAAFSLSLAHSKATPNPALSANAPAMPFCTILASNPLRMSAIYSMRSLTVISYSCVDRLTLLPLHAQTLPQLHSS